jgi:hypothetical protein
MIARIGVRGRRLAGAHRGPHRSAMIAPAVAPELRQL